MTTKEEIAQLRGIAESTDARLANIQESNLGIYATLQLINITLLEMQAESRTGNEVILETLRDMRTEARADSNAILETLRDMNVTLREMNQTLQQRLPPQARG